MDERNQQQGSQQSSQGQSQQSQADYGSAAQANNISGESNIGQQNQQGGVSGLGDADASRSSGQQGSGLGSGGQQQQFDQTGGQQSGGGSGNDRFADQIREHQEVVDDSGQHVGTVDHVDGDRIKLARSDSSDGQHHYVSLSQVAGIDGDKIRLRERGDNDFGQEAN